MGKINKTEEDKILSSPVAAAAEDIASTSSSKKKEVKDLGLDKTPNRGKQTAKSEADEEVAIVAKEENG